MGLLESLSTIGFDPDDDDDLKLRKSLLVICTFPFIAAGVIWGVMYMLFDEPVAGAIPLTYSVFLLFSFVRYLITKRFTTFRNSQLALMLLLPFCLMIALGGYRNGSSVILWSILSPIGAMLFDETRRAVRWVFAFLVLAVISGMLQPILRDTNNLSESTIILFAVMNIFGPGSLVLYMVFYFVRQKNVYQQQSESLLLNILPKEIAKSLKSGQQSIASEFEDASILFADMVNFTPLTEKLTPVGVVDLLNEIFSQFDTLVDKYGLEKIKTIGDCYMVAAGIPRSRADHATAIIDLALDMQMYIASATFADNITVKFRFGINSGPVLAGVIGKKKFSYDVWGDTVNTASRMESHGDGDLIQITRATYDHIKDAYVCESRGTVVVKGKGELEAWIVVSKKHSF